MKALRLFLSALILLTLTSAVFASPCLVYKKDGPASAAFMGWSVAGGKDVNGDGSMDFIVGAYNADSAFVYSGADGSSLYRKGGQTGWQFGWSVALIGDVYPTTPDGKSEFIVGAPNYLDVDHDGAVFVYNGADGNLVPGLSKYGGNPLDLDKFGYSVNGAGDVNADGKADYIVGIPEAGSTDAGQVIVYSGANGSVLFTKAGDGGPHLGHSVASVGDITADGKADIIVGAPYANSVGAAFVYSVTNDSLIFSKYGSTLNGLFGWSVGGGANVAGDSKPDFIVGAPSHVASTDSGKAYVYSGLDASPLYTKTGVVAGDRFGFSVAVAGFVNYDGYADFIVGAPKASSGTGRAYLYSGTDGATLENILGAAAGDEFGTSVAGGGDMVAPASYDEFIVGAPFTDTTGVSNRGTAYVYRYDPTPPSVTVISPNGEEGGPGEYVSKCPCPKFTITWNASDNVGVTSIEIRLDRFNDGVFEQLIANLSGNPGSYDWCPTGSNSNNAKIKVIARDGCGNSGSDVSDNVFTIGSSCAAKVAAILPTFELDQNYPNPFNANTNIFFSLDAPSRVELVVYNILGEKVRTLVSEERAAGAHEVAFDGRDNKGKSLSSGVYFYKLNAGDRVVTKQMMLVK